MNQALLSALSGLRANQQHLDIIGSNLANSSTPGFKSSPVNFVDLYGRTLRTASGPTGTLGGRNPSEVGAGANIGSVDVRMVQGSLLTTGRNLDLGIQGEGFFVLSDGNQKFYTRVGAFGIDAANNLVDLRTGFKVVSRQGSEIQVQLNSVIPAEATDQVDLMGNLPAVITGPLAEVKQTDQPLEDHRPAQLIANAGPYNLIGGETLMIRANFGAIQTVILPPPAVPGAMTAAEIATAINALPITGATAVDNGGTLEIRTNLTGDSRNLFIDPASTGASAVFPAASIGTTVSGTENTAIGTTDLNNLAANTRDYMPGDQIRITGSRPDGTAVTGIFVYGSGVGQDGTTVDAFITKINSIYNATTGGAMAMLNADGTISLTATETGEAALTISVQDVAVPGMTPGATNWSSHFFRTVTEGADPDEERIIANVYDTQGQAHAIEFLLQRQTDGTWSIIPSVDPMEGTIQSSSFTGLGFDPSGILNQVPTATVQVNWNGVPSTQTINLNFGTAGTTDGITQFGLAGTAFATADGYAAGSLTNITVRADGFIEGLYTNGQILELDQLAVALFENPTGLSNVGGALWQVSSNSGDAFFTGGTEGSAGAIYAGTLEASNVDIAEEFVRLIEAQRGFQANARMISTTDEILAELVNII